MTHHVPESQQADFFTDAATKVRRGGTLIYKDISAKPTFWRFCNTLHDLVKARELVHYVPEQRLLRVASRAGLECRMTADVRKLWYMHEIHVLDKPGEIAGGNGLTNAE